MIVDASLEKAANMIGLTPIFEFEGREIHVVCIVPWSPPLIAQWWRGKSANIIGSDVDGNFFLRHCDGSIRYWEHAKQSDTVVAKSVKEFVGRLREDQNDTLSWWKQSHSDTTT